MLYYNIIIYYNILLYYIVMFTIILYSYSSYFILIMLLSFLSCVDSQDLTLLEVIEFRKFYLLFDKDFYK